MTVRSRRTMRNCNVWFLHNDIVAPYVSISMLYLRSLSGKGFFVEAHAEGVLTGEQRNLWQQHCSVRLHSELRVLKELWDVAVVEDLWDVFAAQHTILGAHHALELCIYLEHKGCNLSLEFKFGTCAKTTWRTWYQIQMQKYYPINRTIKQKFWQHSCEQNLKT
jgi:hypothetical protein